MATQDSSVTGVINPFSSGDSWDTDVNESLMANTMDSQTNVLQSITGGAVATAVDIGASLWNSLPGVNEVQTEEILGRISGDALRVYQENPDTINTLSLIGGALLPGAAAVKAMTMMRNGSKAVNWFTKAGKEADMAKAAELFANGGRATTEYKRLQRGIFAKGFANNAVDAAAAEIAILGTMNAHPMMEDYFQDPAKNFAIGVAFGGVVGGTIGTIADRFALKQLTGKVEESVLDTVRNAVRPVLPTMPDATALQTMDASIKNLDNIIAARKELGKTEVDDLTYGIAVKFQSDLRAEQAKMWDSMLDGELKGLSVADKNALLDQVLNNNGFWNVEKIRHVEAKELLPASGSKKPTILSAIPTLKKMLPGNVAESKASTYFPEEKLFGLSTDVKYYAGMSALNLDDKALMKLVPDKASQIPNVDAPFELMSKTSAAAEAEYGAWVKKLDAMDDDAFVAYANKALLSHNDAAQLQAVVARMEKSPALLNRMKIKIADTTPHSQRVLEEVDIARTMGGTPVKYQQAAERILNNKSVTSKYAHYVVGRNDNLNTPSSLVRSWIAGDTWEMIKGATAYFSKGYAAKSVANSDPASVEAARKFQQLYESKESSLLRKDLSQLADKDGKIYLYRGVNAPKIFGSAPLESMAITPAKAGQFATGAHAKTMLYKVDVDDVVSAHVDIGPSGDNVELIVRASAREAEAVLSPDGRIAFREALSKSLVKPATAQEATFGDLQEMLTETKYNMINQMLGRGMPLPVISKRANVSMDSLNAYAASDLTLESFAETAAKGAKFKTSADVDAANSVLNRPLSVSGNMKKHDYTQQHAALNRKNLNDINNGVVSQALFASQSPAAATLGRLIFEDYKPALDIVEAQLGKINNEYAGSRWINSFDFFSRNMGDVGIAVSGIAKDIQKVTNDTIKRVLTPITEAMETVAKDQAALTEFNTLKNLNDSLSGYRVFRVNPEGGYGELLQKVMRTGEDGKPVQVMEPVKFNGNEYRVVTPSVIKLINDIQANSRELLHMQEAARRITGAPAINDIGLWMPSFNPRDKAIAYVHNRATDNTELLYARNETELEDVIKTFSSQMKSDPNLQIVRKSDQATWSLLNGRLDPINMKVADTGMRKSGAGASALPRISTEVLSELVGGYEHHINAQMRNLADVSMSSITDTLRKMSAVNKQATDAQPLGVVDRVTRQGKDAAGSVLNTLLGNPNLGEYEGWKMLNQSFETGLRLGSNTLSATWNATIKPLKGFVKKGELDPAAMKKVDYEAFAKDLKAKGVVNPFSVYDDAVAAEKFGVASLDRAPDSSKRIIYGSNALAATVALRFGELAQPLVNMMSLPILTGMAAAMSKNPTYLGVARSNAQVSGVQIMYEGARAMNSPAFANLDKLWTARGYYDPLVSEASDILRQTRKFDKGAIAAIENGLDSTLVKTMSKPADFSEAMTRKLTMYTGAMLAKRLYPGLDDNGITIFARDFMDKAVGNYTAAQRPVAFQGTLGVALGLFQTYFLTLAQNMYRHLELRDYKALGKAALTQSTIFGASSLPGFDLVSKTIAENYSDDNVDLTTGTYRALGDTGADLVLYGLPSNLGPGFYSRGGIDPRVPNVLGGLQNTVGMSFATQSAAMISSIAQSMGQGDNAGRALMQALSLQNMSRPLARGAELATGYSITRAGNTVQIPEEVWSTTGIISRVLSTRPLEEAKLRQADHLNNHYGSIDRERRQAIVNKLRTDIRAGVLDSAKIAEYAEDYMRRGGTPTGWRSAYKTAIAKTETSGRETLLDSLKDDNPLIYMLDNLD
ncbi:MAG: hypothetical protein AB7F19_07410 [Candidatus Babeliales bacterium]